MVARRKQTPAEKDESGQGRVPVRKSTPLGPDTALTLPTSKGELLDLSYWDLWFAIVAVSVHDGDLDRLAGRLKNEKGFSYDRDSIERKRCHLRDLKRRLEGASVTPTQIVNAAGDLARAEKRRALM